MITAALKSGIWEKGRKQQKFRAGCFGAGGAGTACTGADNVKNGRNQDSKSMTGLEFSYVPFPNVKIDCIKEMGKL